MKKAVAVHIEGQVQGVGFRPFVYRLARSYGLGGWVNNGLQGVRIRAEGPSPAIDAFLKALSNPPDRARIRSTTIEEISPSGETGFRITESEDSGIPNLLLTPDLGLCPDCREEIRDPANRRKGYAFTTCTQCGPRYSITTRLPYDRERTTMAPFQMCSPCDKEYNDPFDRRHYSQTNSCPECPVSMELRDTQGNLLSDEQAAIPSLAARAIREGKIVAIKGIGGFLLMANALDAEAVCRLRERKHRPTKPFALMYPNLKSLEADAELSDKEREAFESIESPIVLIRLKDHPAHSLAMEHIAPGLDRIGAMQPYTPLFQLLMDELQQPVIATSGNPSAWPIVYHNEDAQERLGSIADLLVTNDRDILIPQDDSVLQFSPQHQQPILLRRSRGLAPTLFEADLDPSKDRCLLGMGALLKSTFSLQHQGNTYVSQYLGDLESYDTRENYRRTLDHLLGVFRARPQSILVDHHPDYFATRLGKELAEQWGIPCKEYQHHEAHFAAVMAENELLDQPEPVLGMIWDGTGLGTDGQIWGGEFFTYSDGQILREGHLDYFPVLSGDKMAREPRLSALSLCRELPDGLEPMQEAFSDTEWRIYLQLLEKEPNISTSSMGRLFDGMAGLLGLRHQSSYEGEAALLLEESASRWLRTNPLPPSYSVNVKANGSIPTRPMMEQVLADMSNGKENGYIAARFHRSLVELVRQMAERSGIRSLAFSGGVFQNALLCDLLHSELGKTHILYFHINLSPNDENIAFGQLALEYLDQRKAELKNTTERSKQHSLISQI